mgnify:CR=1 FL=1
MAADFGITDVFSTSPAFAEIHTKYGLSNLNNDTQGVRCHYGSLTGSFGILVQFLLALLAFSCLIGEYTTGPRIPISSPFL